MTIFFKKWWVVLLQGILLVFIGFIFFSSPEEMLALISYWVGILTLTTGALGVIGHLLMNKEERDNSVLWWSIATLILGFLVLAKIGLTIKVITILLGIWIFLTGLLLISAGWEHRKNGIMGWVMLLGGVLSILAGINIVFDIYTGTVWVSTLLGIQALLAGLGLIMLAFIKRKVAKVIRISHH